MVGSKFLSLQILIKMKIWRTPDFTNSFTKSKSLGYSFTFGNENLESVKFYFFFNGNFKILVTSVSKGKNKIWIGPSFQFDLSKIKSGACEILLFSLNILETSYL